MFHFSGKFCALYRGVRKPLQVDARLRGAEKEARSRKALPMYYYNKKIQDQSSKTHIFWREDCISGKGLDETERDEKSPSNRDSLGGDGEGLGERRFSLGQYRR